MPITIFTSFSIGTKINGEFIFGGCFVGPSLNFIKINSPKAKVTGGINLNAQFLTFPKAALGFGLDIFANLNFVQSFCGARLALYFRSLL